MALISTADWRSSLIIPCNLSPGPCPLSQGSSFRLRDPDPAYCRKAERGGNRQEREPESVCFRELSHGPGRRRTGDPADVVGEPLRRRAHGRG